VQENKPDTARAADLNSVPDLEPFLADPIFLARLHRLKVPVGTLAIVSIVVVIIAVSWTSSISNLFFDSLTPAGLGNEIWSYVVRGNDGRQTQVIPYLRDYPSIVLTVTIVTSVCLVYGLYLNASLLHSDMAAAGCVKYSEAGRHALIAAVTDVNTKLSRFGRAAPIVLLVAAAFSLLVNLRLQGSLFQFLSGGDLYSQWWASLDPVRPGGVAWVILGAIGIYMVYVEAVLGLLYVGFLRKCRGDYQFRANMVNPDGFYGWTRLRRLISNMQAGVLCTLLSSWAMSFFLQPAVGSVITAMVLVVFGGVVMYVFIEVNLNFRRQVREDKNLQRAEIGNELARQGALDDVPSLLRTLVAYQRLELTSKIPTTPIRQRWLVAGALSVVGPICAIILQLVKYFAP